MYDYLIKNVLVADGTGRAPYSADVAIAGEKIAAMIQPMAFLPLSLDRMTAAALARSALGTAIVHPLYKFPLSDQQCFSAQPQYQ